MAYAAREAGIACSVVAIETAPQTKLERMRALGANIVPVSYEQAWKAAEAHAFDGLDGTFIHPFDNHQFIAGHGTMGLEIVEQLPNVQTVIAAIGGGGLITGVGSAMKALRPEVRALGAEPETAAPYAYSLRQGATPGKFPDWQASFVDGAGGQASPNGCGSGCSPSSMGRLPYRSMRPGGDAVDRGENADDFEGAGALALAAALTGKAGEGPIVCVVSGGNIRSGQILRTGQLATFEFRRTSRKAATPSR